MYQEEILKEISPSKTYRKCKNIFMLKKNFKRYNILEIKKFKEINKKYNIRISSMIINYNNLKIASFGKGIKYNQCMSSMYMESIERISFYIHYNIEKTNYQNNIKTYINYIDKNFPLLKAFTEILLREKRSILSFKEKIKGEKKKIINLIKVIDLINNEEIKIPKEIFQYNISDGWNSGNTDEEAILGGIYEVIERYCIKNIFENSLEKMNVFQLYPKEIIIKNNKKLTTLSKILSDKNISNIKILEMNLKGTHIYIYSIAGYYKGTFIYGSGCHSIKDIGLTRAVTEFIQGLGVDINKKYFDKDKNPVYSNFYTKKLEKCLILKNYKEKIYSNNNININNIKGLLKVVIDQLKSININYILCFNANNKDFNIPIYMIKIPKFGEILQSKYNCKYQNNIKGLNIANNIEGIKYIVYYSRYKGKNIEKIYYNMLSYMCDKTFFSYLYKIHNLNIIENREFIVNLEKENPMTYSFFYKTLSRKQKSYTDYLYLFKIYNIIGFTDYGFIFLKKNNIIIDKNIINIYNKFQNLEKINFFIEKYNKKIKSISNFFIS